MFSGAYLDSSIQSPNQPRAIETAADLIEDRHAMCAAWLVGVALGAAAVGDLPTLRITVYDQARLTEEVARSTFDQLGLIFRRAGIRIEPVAGDPAVDEAKLYTYETWPTKENEQEVFSRARQDIALQIAGGPIPGLSKRVLGTASPLASAGLNARVFEEHIRRAALLYHLPYENVLACAIAHEVGHVLLRSNAHGEYGLMFGVWSRREYRTMAVPGALLFTRGESDRMRRNLRSPESDKRKIIAPDERSGCATVARRLWNRPYEPDVSRRTHTGVR